MGKSTKRVWLLPKPSRLFRYVNAISSNPSWNRACSSDILVPAAPQHIPDHFTIPLVLNISPFPNGAAASSGFSTFCPFPSHKQTKSAADVEQNSKLDCHFQGFTCTQPQRAMEKKKSCTTIFQESQNIKPMLLPCTAQHLETRSGKNYFSIRNVQV